MKRRHLGTAATTSTAATAVMLLAVMLSAGCGTGPDRQDPARQSPAQQEVQPPGSPAATASAAVTSTAFNATDVMFLQMMVAQYGPAAEILKLARSRSRDEKVTMLAAAVDVTQADELATMRQWLNGWQQPIEPDAEPATHAGHGGLPTTGKAEIAALAAASGADFDRTFLNLLIGHQHQAVEYARMELTTGTNTAVRDLAQRIDQSRTAQITMMLALVARPA